MHVNILTNSEQSLHCGGCHAEVENEEHFSIVLGKILDKTTLDLSTTAASNDKIVRQTVEYFETGNTCDVVVLILSANDRIDYPVRYNEYQDITSDGVRDHQFPEDRYLDFQNYFSNIYNSYLGSDNYHKNLFFLKTYFKLKGINHYIMDWKESFSKYPSPWKDWVDPVISFKTKFLGVEEVNNPNFNHHHPSAVGHRLIAEHVSENIKQYFE